MFKIISSDELRKESKLKVYGVQLKASVVIGDLAVTERDYLVKSNLTFQQDFIKLMNYVKKENMFDINDIE